MSFVAISGAFVVLVGVGASNKTLGVIGGEMSSGYDHLPKSPILPRVGILLDNISAILDILHCQSSSTSSMTVSTA